MAALCTGNYGLSQNCTDNGKELFFVKLTDSAYRAVEDYHKNQGKNNTQATIQIVGNGGVLSFPSSGHIQQFRFSIDDIESFECIKQTQNQLEVQGALPYKLRIHANDDVYETTRHRMAVAEENQKNKCTREIKPNQTDIGRKVKLKNSSNRVSNIPPKRDSVLVTSVRAKSPLSSSTSSTILNPVSSSTQQLTSSASASNLGSQFTTGNSTISPLQTSSSLSSSSASSLLNSSTISSSGTLAGLSTNSAFSSISPLHTINTSLKNSNSNLNNNSSLNNLTSNNNSTSSKLHSSYSNNNNNNNLHHNNSTSSSNLSGVSSASSLSSALSSAAGSGTSGIASSYYSSSNNSSGLRASNGMAIGTNNSINNVVSRRTATGPGMNNRNQRNGSRHMPDITKKKIRDRLIHLLALKPYKKPELFSRLQNEGIREREKSSIGLILKEISNLRDNSYNLKRQMWNDVNEDWPFYTEQELQMLKRRKPQNLTPPPSSDGGSSTSGQSPTSTHNGSPPPAVKRPSLGDRDRFYEEPAVKKQRISHFRKDNNEINSSNITTMPTSRHHQEPEDNAMSISYALLGTEAARRISPRDDTTNGHSNLSNSSSSSHHHNIPNSHHHNANNNNTNSNNKNSSNNTIMSSSGNAHHKSPTPYSHQNSNNNVSNSGNNGNSTRLVDSRKSSSSSSSASSLSPMTTAAMNTLNVGSGGGSIGAGNGGGITGESSPGAATRTTNMNVSIMTGLNDRGSAINRCENTNNHLNNNNNVNQGSNNRSSINSSNNAIGGPKMVSGNHGYDFSEFTNIYSVDQRRLYKAEFEKNYKEYRDLLNTIEGVSKKFNVLAHQLEEAKSTPSTYREIRRKILNEYEKINRDRNHQKVKARFDYLHEKLAHIKGLVHVFDQTLTGSDGNGLPNSDMNQSPIQNIADFSGNVNLSAANGFNNNNSSNSNNISSSSSSRNGGNLSSHRTSPIGGGSTGAQNLHHQHHHHLQENY